MNLKEIDIINAIESYRNKHRLSQKKMAVLCGMSSSSVYNNWIHQKTKGRIEYLIEFMNNADVVFCDKNKLFESKNNIEDTNSSPGHKSPDETQINEKELNCLKDENLNLYRELHRLSNELIEMLKRQGGDHAGKRVRGDLEEPKKTG